MLSAGPAPSGSAESCRARQRAPGNAGQPWARSASSAGRRQQLPKGVSGFAGRIAHAWTGAADRGGRDPRGATAVRSHIGPEGGSLSRFLALNCVGAGGRYWD
jgi:hypothetical protein